MIYSRHLGSQYKPFALNLNRASQQDSVHIKETHGMPLPSSLEKPKFPQKNPSSLHSINSDSPQKGRAGMSKSIVINSAPKLLVSIHNISWIRFIKTDISSNRYSKTQTNFGSKLGPMWSWQPSTRFPQSCFFRLICTCGVGAAFNLMPWLQWPTNQATKSRTDASVPVPERHLGRMAGQPDNEKLLGGHQFSWGYGGREKGRGVSCLLPQSHGQRLPPRGAGLPDLGLGLRARVTGGGAPGEQIPWERKETSWCGHYG